MQLDCWSSVGFAQDRGESYGGVGLGEDFCLYLVGVFLSVWVILLGWNQLRDFTTGFGMQRGKDHREGEKRDCFGV